MNLLRRRFHSQMMSLRCRGLVLTSGETVIEFSSAGIKGCGPMHVKRMERRVSSYAGKIMTRTHTVGSCDQIVSSLAVFKRHSNVDLAEGAASRVRGRSRGPARAAPTGGRNRFGVGHAFLERGATVYRQVAPFLGSMTCSFPCVRRRVHVALSGSWSGLLGSWHPCQDSEFRFSNATLSSRVSNA